MAKTAKTTLVKVKRHYQITIPSNLRKKFRLTEGDFMEIEDKNNGIVIRPVKLVHPDQAYFNTKEWQKGEAEADRDIAAGRISKAYTDIDELLKDLKS